MLHSLYMTTIHAWNVNINVFLWKLNKLESRKTHRVRCRSWPEPSPTTPVGIPWLIGWSRMVLGLGLVLAACRCFEKTPMYHNICQRMKVWFCYVLFNERMILLCVVQWNLLVVFLEYQVVILIIYFALYWYWSCTHDLVMSAFDHLSSCSCGPVRVGDFSDGGWWGSPWGARFQ